jgi:hypothetical protein
LAVAGEGTYYHHALVVGHRTGQYTVLEKVDDVRSRRRHNSGVAGLLERRTQKISEREKKEI